MSHVLPYVSMGVLSAVIAYFAISSSPPSTSSASEKKTQISVYVTFEAFESYQVGLKVIKFQKKSESFAVGWRFTWPFIG